MCGIAGEVSGAPASGAAIEDQLATLRHRGPDANGWFPDGTAVVGQARLSIIDVEHGDPPLTSEDGRIVAVLNGEIYNFRELAGELDAGGHRLASRCDTEVLAHLAESDEPVALARRLKGMFAYAIWDGRNERLQLGRDRLGKKPLYYWADPRSDRLVFGSEIKALLAHPAVPCELDETAIPAFLTFGYAPTPVTFFRGVRSVPPGHVLVWERGTGVRIERYWDAPLSGVTAYGPELSFQEAADEVRRLLRAAVERRLIADRPLGAFLSGGIDSTAIVGIMSELSDRPVSTFTIGFDDTEGFDEREHAALVAERFRTHHHEFVVAPSAVELLEKLVWHHDQPFGDSSALPTYLLSELTGQHVTVALSGDGGDEVFGGYERFVAARLLRGAQRLPAAGRAALVRAAQGLPAEGRGTSLRRLAASLEDPMPDGYARWLAIASPEDRAALLGDRADGALDDYRGIWNASDGAAFVDRLLHLNLQTYLLDDLLVKVDRMSMAHGLEVRSPFLDVDLLEFVAALPPAYKVGPLSLKRVLRRAVDDLVPPELLHRRKRGFGVPLARWFREELRDHVSSTLGSPAARVRRYVDGAALDRVIATHQRGEGDKRHTLWALLTLEVFLEQHGW